MKAVKKHTENKWVRLYIERWLKTPMQMPDGSLQEKTKGTMQGGVISPLLSNLFLHYVFDTWMQRKHPIKKWCRYADDGLVHCNTESDAKALFTELEQRFAECSLQLHPDKTKIIYCRDKSRKGKYDKTSFDFLGYTFRPRVVKNQKTGEMFVGFTPAVSKASKKSIRSKMKLLRCRRKTELSLEEIADRYNPKLRGWINYYGRFNRSALYPVLRTFNKTLVDWAMRKYKRFGKGKTQAARYLMKIAEEKPETFVHWEIGMVGSFA